ncbi:SPFH domain-containing protein [Sphaerisporangium sp. TRM90804]|uniref:SPFH domain-containing protein n=1 Tax=Sphaerisporangium sp. TRM90804 TaxID=3031113 RepID=UPI00244C6657|nr:SPFH domain-containing protein [Sphaerisporangium sp. TRM90804]MDH2429945.1 SPFH domain-containing protein [Sphaerisporangium sp. TRM90804]
MYTRAILVSIAVATAVITAITSVIGLFVGLESTNGGEVAVVRDGGPFDDNLVRQIIDPASGVTWTGWWSQVHVYPAQQRFYTITADAKRSTLLGVDVVTVPSSDGVNMGIEGTLYFTLNLDHETLRVFDDKFGTRRFRGQDNEMRYPYEGEEGWSAFFGQAIRPVVDNALRSQVGAFRCAELVSSCAFVESGAARETVRMEARENNATLTRIQEAVNSSLDRDLRSMLGAPFLTDLRFNLVKVSLPQQVQASVDRAQAAFASLAESQAAVAQARAQAEANKARQDGYNACTTCAEIEKLKALPQGITVYAPGNAGGVALPTR